MNAKQIGLKLKESFGLKYFPVGITFTDAMPENAKHFITQGGCVVSLIFLSAKGETVGVDKDTAGRPCSAFYLGYQDWIFDGIECFLSDGVVPGRESERFIKTEKLAKDFVTSLIPQKINEKVTVFKPLEAFTEREEPQLVVFFATPDELSGLVTLLHYNAPGADDIVLTGFGSGCGSIVTRPMRLLAEGKKKAVWGMHDIAARLKLPKDIMTLTMPYSMVVDMAADMDTSFLITHTWAKIKERRLPDKE